MNDNSILQSIKKLLGITEEYTHYDLDIILHINSTLSLLNQLGIGPKDGFHIDDETTTWDDYISDTSKIEFVKSYVYLKVRLLFDPPSSSIITEVINKQISELEWRLNVSSDTTNN